jgi:hypothetical protein
MVGRMISNASSRNAIEGVFSKVTERTRAMGGCLIAGVAGLKRVGAVALLGAIVAAAGLPVLGSEKSPAPAPAVDAVAADLVNKAEQHLSEIGYWSGPAGDRSAARTRCAILAFQRVEGRSQTGKLDAADIQALLSAKRPIPRETGYAHIEVDLQRQVLFVVDQNSAVTTVLPISSGSGKLYTFEGKTSRAVTPRGRFTVYRKVAGWRKAPLGMIYYPNYFNEGWAIHGSSSVPNYPASHGCIRIPIVTAKELSDITPMGTVVLVYG